MREQLTRGAQHKTIESVLQRGEKLDNLVERSEALSAQSKMFYKTAKKVKCRQMCLMQCVLIVTSIT